MDLLVGMLVVLMAIAAAWLLVKVLHARRRFQRRIIEGERRGGNG